MDTDVAKEEAIREAELADSAEQRADAQRDQALRTLSLLLAELPEQGNATSGILLALAALPKDTSTPDRPYVVEAALPWTRRLRIAG